MGRDCSEVLNRVNSSHNKNVRMQIVERNSFRCCKTNIQETGSVPSYGALNVSPVQLRYVNGGTPERGTPARQDSY